MLATSSEQKLARSVWPGSIGNDLFVQVVGRQLRQMAQAGRDILEARRQPEKVRAMHRSVSRIYPYLVFASRLSTWRAAPTPSLTSAPVAST